MAVLLLFLCDLKIIIFVLKKICRVRKVKVLKLLS